MTIDRSHYERLGPGYQVFDVLRHWLTPEEFRGWIKGAVFACLARERNKGGDVDIEKAFDHLAELLKRADADGDTCAEQSPEIECPACGQASDIEHVVCLGKGRHEFKCLTCGTNFVADFDKKCQRCKDEGYVPNPRNSSADRVPCPACQPKAVPR